LASMTFVVTDSLMLPQLPANCDARCFTILGDSSLDELRQFSKQFMDPGKDTDNAATPAVTRS